MPYDFKWYDTEHTIMQIDIYGDVTWTEYHAIHETIYAELVRSPHRVDLIFNDQAGMPKGNAMPHLKTVIGKLVAFNNLGMIYTVSAQTVSMFVRAMIDLSMRVYRIDRDHYGGFVASLDEALALIQKDRAEVS